MFTHYKSLSDAEELYFRLFIIHHIRFEPHQPVWQLCNGASLQSFAMVLCYREGGEGADFQKCHLIGIT